MKTKTHNRFKKRGLLTMVMAGMLFGYNSLTFADTLSGSNIVNVQVKSDGFYFVYNALPTDGSCNQGEDADGNGINDSGYYMLSTESHYKEALALVLMSYTMKIPLSFTYSPGLIPCYVTDVEF